MGSWNAERFPSDPTEAPWPVAAEHSWGLRRAGPGRWQVEPSIKCLDRIRDPADPTKSKEIEVWHETPAVVDVPEDEPWSVAAAP